MDQEPINKRLISKETLNAPHTYQQYPLYSIPTLEEDLYVSALNSIPDRQKSIELSLPKGILHPYQE